MFAQNYSTLLGQTRPFCGLSIDGWLRRDLKVSSSHCHLQSYDFLRLSRKPLEVIQAFPLQTGTSPLLSPLGLLGGRGLLEMNSPGQPPPVLHKQDLNGRASRWQERLAQVSASIQLWFQLSACESILCSCIWVWGGTQDLSTPPAPRILKAHLEKLCFGV